MSNQEPTFTNKHLYYLTRAVLEIFYVYFIDFIHKESNMKWTRIYALHAETREEKLEQVDVINNIALALVKRKCQSTPWGKKVKIVEDDNSYSTGNNWYNYYVLVPKLSQMERDSLDDLGFETADYGFISRVERRKNYVKIKNNDKHNKNRKKKSI